MHQNFQGMMLNQRLELKLSVKDGFKDHYIRSAFFILEIGPKSCISLHTPVPIRGEEGELIR